MVNTIKKNPKLSLLGIICALSIVIVAKPDLISFLPNTEEDWVKGIAGLIAAVSGYLGFTSSPNSSDEELEKEIINTKE